MLPVVLACYEMGVFGQRRWKPLVPFFAASLSFGLQGLLLIPIGITTIPSASR